MPNSDHDLAAMHADEGVAVHIINYLFNSYANICSYKMVVSESADKTSIEAIYYGSG